MQKNHLFSGFNDQKLHIIFEMFPLYRKQWKICAHIQNWKSIVNCAETHRCFSLMNQNSTTVNR